METRKKTPKSLNGEYNAPQVKVVVINLKETILQGSYTNNIEKSGEEEEIDW